jgi:CBS domain-containing protein
MEIFDRNSKVREAMTYPLITASSNDTVSSVLGLMINNHKGFIIICRGGLLKEIEGIITNGMILNKIYIEGLDPDRTKASDIMMRTPLICIDPDSRLEDAISLMKLYNIRRLPVVKEQVLVGVVTLRDIFHIL